MARVVKGVPIPTGKEVAYSGRIFVSGLEARWALFLDLLGINWDFEPSHYQLADRLWYKPDFYLPELHIWLEVKGIPFFARSDALAKAVLSVSGPSPLPQREHPYEESKFILLGGDLLRPKTGRSPVHAMMIRASAGSAASAYVRFSRTDDGWMLKRTTGALKTFDAKTVQSKPATHELADHLLQPPQAEVEPDEFLAFAYRSAANVRVVKNTFDVSSHRDAAALLIRRRAGRPLPRRAWPKNFRRI